MVDYQPSLAAGTVMLELGLEPWPFPESALFLEMQLIDGSLIVAGHPDGRIEVSLRNLKAGEDGSLCSVITPLIEPISSIDLKLAAAWSSGQIDAIYINGNQIFPECTVEKLTLENKNNDLSLVSYQEKNEAARAHRTTLLQQVPNRANRRDGGEEYLIGSLIGEVEQLEDLIGALKAGREAHVAGLAARIRLLMIGQPFGLLQHCAAYRQCPLIVYTGRNPELAPPMEDCVSIFGNVSGEPSGFFCTAVDLDVWLKFPALQSGNRSYSHSDLIRDFGDTIGAHRDPGITEPVDIYTRIRSQSGIRYGGVQKYIFEVSQATLMLSRRVIETSRTA